MSSYDHVSQSIDDKKSSEELSSDHMKSSMSNCLDFWKNGSIELGHEVFKNLKT